MMKTIRFKVVQKVLNCCSSLIRPRTEGGAGKFNMGPSYRFNDFSLEPPLHRLMRGNQQLFLRPKSFETLLYLVRHRDRVVPKNELLEVIWPETFVVETVLRQCISEIRTALHDNASRPRYLKTIPKVGHQFIAETREVDSPLEPCATEPPSPPMSIAVLPFRDMSPQRDHGYFCEGVAEEIIDSLAHLDRLHVAARTSTLFFKDKVLDLCQIGRTLNVETILEGSLRISGDRLRVGAQLIRAADGFHLWSERFEFETGDIFEVQDQITRRIVQKLRIELLSGEEALLDRRGTENPEAYLLNLKGRYFEFREGAEDLKKAIGYFKKAVELDSEYAQAYARIANCYASLGFWGGLPPSRAYPAARKAAARALTTDPASSMAHGATTLVALFDDWDWEAANRASVKAVDLNPKSESARIIRAYYFVAIGDLEAAITECLKGLELAPLSHFSNSYLGWCMLRQGRLEEAIDQLGEALELEPRDPRTRLFLGQAYVLNSEFENGIAEIQESFKLSGKHSAFLAGLGWAYGKVNRRSEAQRVLRELKRRSQEKYPCPYLVAKVYCGMDETELALKWLDRAVSQRDNSLTFVKTDESLATLRDDPRFGNLLHRMKLAL